MAKESRFLHYLIIVSFSVGVVMMGYRDLRRVYSPSYWGSSGGDRSVSKDLLGTPHEEQGGAKNPGKSIGDRFRSLFSSENEESDDVEEEEVSGLLQRMAP